MDPGAGLAGWLGWSAHSLGAALCKDQGQYPAFVPGTSLRSGSWFGAFLYLIVHNLPQLCMCEIGFSPLLFLCILLLEKTFVQEPVL